MKGRFSTRSMSNTQIVQKKTARANKPITWIYSHN